jgi:hypothetical protein
MPSPTFVKIASTTLVSATPTFDFTAIPNTYYDLRLHLSVRSDLSAANDCNVNLTVNGLTTSSYRSVLVYPTSNSTSAGNSNGVGDAFQAGMNGANSLWGGGIMPAANGTTNAFMNGTVLIGGYTQTSNTWQRAIGTHWGGIRNGGSNVFWGIVGTQVKMSAAVNRITLTASGSNFVVGSTVSLYGCTNTVT